MPGFPCSFFDGRRERLCNHDLIGFDYGPYSVPAHMPILSTASLDMTEVSITGVVESNLTDEMISPLSILTIFVPILFLALNL